MGELIFKCKPTYQFQSIEFEMACDPDNPDSLSKLSEVYSKVLNELIRISPEQEKKVAKVSEPLATPGQKATMDRFGIAYNETTTKKQAQALIQASVDGLGI